MLTVFLGSAGEHAGSAIPLLADALSKKGLVPEVWTKAFSPGEPTITELREIALKCQAAIFLFARDDRVTRRGRRTFSPRDNVVFEHGLFYGMLGRGRVFFILEKDSKPPTDLDGVTYLDITSLNPKGMHLETDLQACVSQIVQKLHVAARRTAELGLATVLPDLQRGCEDSRSWFSEPNPQGGLPCYHPYVFSTYLEAISSVRDRFWTTTFLTSGFWTESRALDDNLRLTRRTKAGALRRLILLNRPAREELESVGKRLRDLHRLGWEKELLREISTLQGVLKRHRSLIESKFETRVVFLSEERARVRTPNATVINLLEHELAIYDSSRIDFFVGRYHNPSSVLIFIDSVKHFYELRVEIEGLFADLWADPSAEDARIFFESLEREVARSLEKIDHEKMWVWSYENALAPRDINLKDRELETVEGIINKQLGPLVPRNYLDVGTCSGRYPIALSSRVEGKITAIDFAPEAIAYSRWAVTNAGLANEKINLAQISIFELSDDEKYCLITCMMSTISYFSDAGKVLLFRKLSKLLEADGLLVLSKWSDSACAELDFISIYTEADKRRIKSNTPPNEFLERALPEAGLEIREQCSVEGRLDVVVCRRVTRP